MLKKSLLSLAIAAGLGLAGCSGTDSTGTTGPNGGVVVIGGDGNTRVIFEPAAGNMPLATDLLFASAADSDGTASTADTTPPVTTALNDLAGFSNITQIDIAFDDSIDPASINTDPASANQNVFLIKLAADAKIQELDIQQIAALAHRQTLVFKAYAAAGAYLTALGQGADAATARATAAATAASPAVQIPPFAPTSALKTAIDTQLQALDGGALDAAYASFQPIFDSLTNTGFLPGDVTNPEDEGYDASLRVTTPVGFAYATYKSHTTGPELYAGLVDEFNVASTDPEALNGVSATLYDGDYRAEVISLNGASNNVLRISQLSPLDPKSKYVVAVVGGANGIKDASGAPVLASATYNDLKKDATTDPITTNRLAAVQSLTNALEDIVAGYVGATKGIDATQIEQDIVLSYAFTTDATDDVLLGMTVPNVAIDTALPSVIASIFAAANAPLVEAQYRSANGIESGVDLSVNQQAELDSLQSTFATNLKVNPEVAVAPASVSLDAYNAAISAGLNTALEAESLQDALPKPAASSELGFWNTIEATSGSISFPATGDDASVGMTVAPGKVYEGWITLPYYGYAPDGSESSTAGVDGIKGSRWVPDQELGAELETALTSALGAPVSGILPPKDTDGTYNVTYNYPWAKKQSDVVVPMVVSYPGMSSVIDPNSGATLEQAILASHMSPSSASLSDALTAYFTAVAGAGEATIKAAILAGDPTGVLRSTVDGPYPTVIYNHGITNDRSNSLPLGNQLGFACVDTVSQPGLMLASGLPCYVTVAIDQPLHGASVTFGSDGIPTGSASQIAGLTNVNLAAASGALPSDVPTELSERHFGYTVLDPTTLEAGKSPNGAVASGSLFINLANFQNTRDNLLQQVLDLSTLNASLISISTALQEHDSSVEGLLTYTSPIGTPSATTHFVGHSLGGVNGIPYVASNNKSFGGAALTVGAIVAAGDTTCASARCQRYIPAISPVLGANFAMTGGAVPKMLENSSDTTFGAPAILTGLRAAGVNVGTSSYESYLNVFQATIEASDPVGYASLYQQGALSSATPGSLFFEIAGERDANGTFTSPADQTIPNDADNRPMEPLDLTSIGFAVNNPSPLAGTEPLVREAMSNSVLPSSLPLTGLGDVANGEGVYNDLTAFRTAGQLLAADAGATSDSISVTSRFNAGSHTTIVSADNSAVFREMVGQIATFFATSGRAMLVRDSSVLSDCDPTANAEDPQCLNP